MTAVENAPAADVKALILHWDRFVCNLAGRIARQFRLEPEDVESEFRLALLAGAQRFDPARSGFGTWCVIVARKVRDALARNARRSVTARRVVVRSISEERRDEADAVDLVADPTAADPSQVASDNERRGRLCNLIDDALAALPVHQREAVRRRFWSETETVATPADRGNLRDALEALRGRLARPDECA